MDNSLAARSPAEIDTQLEALMAEGSRLSSTLGNALGTIHRIAGDTQTVTYVRRIGIWTWGMKSSDAIARAKEIAVVDDGYAARRAEAAVAAYVTATAAVAANTAAQAPLHAEFNRRRWTRAYLCVSNGTGHVHSSTNCSTCHRTTRFNWRTEMSGLDEAEIVERSGERACTVCYPSAPVETRTRPTQVFSPEEIANRIERERRAAARAEKLAKQEARALKAATKKQP